MNDGKLNSLPIVCKLTPGDLRNRPGTILTLAREATVAAPGHAGNAANERSGHFNAEARANQ